MTTASHEPAKAGQALKKLYNKRFINEPYVSLKQFARTLDPADKSGTSLVKIWFDNKRSNTRIKPQKPVVKNEEGKKNIPPPRKR